MLKIIKYLIELHAGKKQVDDIDHLGNRRVRTVGEQLATQVNIGMARMARTIKERMNIHDMDNFAPSELVNARTITSVINTFFGNKSAFTVHGPNQPVVGDDAQASYVRFGSGWSYP